MDQDEFPNSKGNFHKTPELNFSEAISRNEVQTDNFAKKSMFAKLA